MKGKMLKRMLLSVLSLALTFSMIQFNPVHVHASGDKSITAAELVANNYASIVTEKNGTELLVDDVLLSGALNTTEFEYVVPTNSNLVKVDPENRTIKADTYTDDHGNAWIPVEAYVTGRDEPYTLVNGECTFADAGDKYTVKVTYKAYVEYSKDAQVQLLNAAYNLFNAKEALDTLVDTASDLELLAGALLDVYPDFELLVQTGANVPTDLVEAMEALIDQVKDDEAFTLNDLIEAYYDNYDNYVEYFYSEDIKTLKAEAVALAGLLEVIYEYEDYFDLDRKVSRALESLINDLKDYSSEEYWAPLYIGNNVPLVDLDSDYSTLEEVVAELKTKVVDEYTIDQVNEKLLLAQTEISASVAMHDVNVVVNGTVYDDEGDKPDLEQTTTITVDDGSTEDAIFAHEDVTAFLTNVKNAWNQQLAGYAEGYVVNDTTYNVVYNGTDTNDDNEIDTLEINYVPNKVTFTVTSNGNPVSEKEVDYGSVIVLDSKATEGSYEYKINGTGYTQGQKYRILADTEALRTETTVVKTSSSIYKVIAKDAYYGLNSITKNILNSAALKAIPTSYVVLNEKNPANVTLEDKGNGYLLTAPSYSAYVDNMEWVPVAYSVNGGAKVAMDGNSKLLTEAVSNVEVFYELKVTKNSSTGTEIYDVNAKLNEWINLPAQLVEDVKGQLEVLDRLSAMADKENNPDGAYLTMGSLINSALNVLADQYSDPNIGKYKAEPEDVPYETEDLKEYLAIRAIKNNCFNGTELKLLSYVKEYNDNGLITYYRDYNHYLDQLSILCDNLQIVLNSDEFETIKTSPDYAQFKDQLAKVDTVQATLDDARQKLVVPHAAIISYNDANHSAIANLLTLLQSEDANNVNKVADTTNGLHEYYSVKVVNTEANFIYNIVVNVNGGADENQYTFSFDFPKFTELDVNAIKTKVEELNGNVDSKHYTVDSYKLPEAGDKIEKDMTLTINWNVNEYEVVFEDEGGKKLDSDTIVYDDTRIELPQSADQDVYYIYVVNGHEYNTQDKVAYVDVTTGANGNFDTLFNNGTLTIVRKEVNVKQEQLGELETYVEELNKSFGTLNTRFVLIESNGEYKMVLRVDPKEATQLSGVLQTLGLAMINADYQYIALGKDENVFFDGLNSQITLQALINAVLYSDFNSDVLYGLTNDKGQVVDNVPTTKDDKVVVGGNVKLETELGGTLLETSLVLGTDANNIQHNIPFFVTVEDFGSKSEDLADVDKLLTKLENYLTFNTDNDEFNFICILPDDGYKVVLATMLLAGYADLDDVTDVQFDKFVEYVTDQYDAIMNDDVELNATVIQNTLNKLGIDKSISKYSKYINWAIKALGDLTLTAEGEKLAGEYNTDVYPLISKVDQLPDAIKGMLVTDLYAPVNAEITNVGTAYDAIVIDLFNDGKKVYRRVDFSKNIEADIANLADNSVVILLQDADELNVKENVVLDLNGNNVGNIVVADEAHLRIFDSAFVDGTVNGIEGTNVTITGGIYAPKVSFFGLNDVDVADYLPEGYVQNDDGSVTHRFFSITETTDGIVIEINPDIEGVTKEDLKEMDYKYLAADLALTLGLHYYNASSLTIEGKEIYGITPEFADLVALYEDSTKLGLVNDVVDILNCNGVTDFVNNVLIPQLTDFDAIADSIRDNDGVVATYDIVTHPFNIEADLVKDAEGNYATAGITSNDKVKKEDTLIIKINKETADKYLVADMLDILNDVLTVDKDTKLTFSKVDVNSVSKENIDVTTDLAFNGKATVQFKDAKYTVLMATVLAYGTNDADLIDALKDYICKNETKDLIAAIESHTVADMYNAIVKATADDVDLADMFKAIGINLSDYKDAYKTEEIVDAYLRLAMKGVKYLGAHDSTRALAVKGEVTRTFKNRVTLTLAIDLIAKNEPCDHTWGNWEIVSGEEPTCTKTGLEKRTCEICGDYETRSVDKLPHGTPVLDPTTVIIATCTNPGYTGDYVCPDCGEVLVKGTATPLEKHDTELVGYEPATCTKPGYSGDLVCKVCGTLVEKGHALPLEEHDTHIVGAKAPTCTEPGYTGDEVCKVCGTIVKEGTVINAHGHNYVNGVCTICGDKLPGKPTTSDTTNIAFYSVAAVLSLGLLIALKKKRGLTK